MIDLSLNYIEFEYFVGSFQKQVCGLYDARDLSEEEVLKLIQQYPDISDSRLVFMSKEQFTTVFRSVFADVD